MTTLRAIGFFAIIVLLASCSVTVTPGADITVQGVTVSGDQLVNERLGLQGYPGATVISQEQGRDDSRTTFETGANLERVYAHFHGQLISRGWQRTDLKANPNRMSAEYGRNGDELEFDLHREGNSERYRLALELDD